MDEMPFGKRHTPDERNSGDEIVYSLLNTRKRGVEKINVREPIDAFSKLSIEGEFQKYSLGGAISYIEMPSMMHNIEAIIKVIQHIYDNCMYAELNTKSDYCQACGFDGEIQIIEDEDGHLDWECPRCGNRDHNTLTVTRRSCGYLGTQFWNQGRTEEIRDRVLHL